ncbi:MAG TPA: CrcB family protein [Acidimicrobiales bacterium]|nr:CrcB family protein [Acidimicrobiales bacterium]
MANLTLAPRQFVKALIAVFIGGALGTFLRDVALKIDPVPKTSNVCLRIAIFSNSGANCPEGYAPVWWFRDVPWTLLVINAMGVFVVTRLLRTILRGHDPNDLTRLFVVTGFFGGFTSYSSLIGDLAPLWSLSKVGAILVALTAIFSGVLAAWVGLGRRRSVT